MCPVHFCFENLSSEKAGHRNYAGHMCVCGGFVSTGPLFTSPFKRTRCEESRGGWSANTAPMDLPHCSG